MTVHPRFCRFQGFRFTRLSLGLFLALVMLSACGTKTGESILIKDAPGTAAMAATSDGGFFYANRTTGDVFKSDANGKSALVTHVDVSSDGQRGLLGLVVDKDQNLFATWTDTSAERRINVGQLLPGAPRIVWRGPPSADVANGGHLAMASDGRIAIGIGDLLDESKLTDPLAPNGKMLSLDPSGNDSQTPQVMSAGWHNPFAFAYDGANNLWVADNSPAQDERLAKSGPGGVPTDSMKIGDQNAPSGLAYTNGNLYVCLYNANRIDRYELSDKAAPQARGEVVKGCSLGVAPLTDGRIVYASERDIRVFKP